MVRHLRVMNDPLSKDQEELLSTEQRANQLYRTVIGQKFHTIIKMSRSSSSFTSRFIHYKEAGDFS